MGIILKQISGCFDNQEKLGMASAIDHNLRVLTGFDIHVEWDDARGGMMIENGHMSENSSVNNQKILTVMQEYVSGRPALERCFEARIV